MTTHEEFVENAIQVAGMDPNSQEFKRWLASGNAAGLAGFISLDENGAESGDNSSSKKAEKQNNAIKEALSNTIDSINGKIDGLLDKIAGWEKERDALKKELAETEQQIEIISQQIIEATEEAQEVDQRLEEMQDTWEHNQQEIDNTGKAIEASENAIGQNSSAMREFFQDFSENEKSNLTRLQSKQDRLRQEIFNTLIDQSGLENRIASLEDRLSQARMHSDNVRSEIEKLGENITTAKSEVAKLEAQRELEAQLEKTQIEIDQLTTRIESMSHPDLVSAIQSGEVKTWEDTINLLPEDLRNQEIQEINIVSGNPEWLKENFGDDEAVMTAAHQAYEISETIFDNVTDTFGEIGEKAQQLVGSMIWNNRLFQKSAEATEKPNTLSGTESINDQFSAAHDNIAIDNQSFYQASQVLTWQPGAVVY